MTSYFPAKHWILNLNCHFSSSFLRRLNANMSTLLLQKIWHTKSLCLNFLVGAPSKQDSLSWQYKCHVVHADSWLTKTHMAALWIFSRLRGALCARQEWTGKWSVEHTGFKAFLFLRLGLTLAESHRRSHLGALWKLIKNSSSTGDPPANSRRNNSPLKSAWIYG